MEDALTGVALESARRLSRGNSRNPVEEGSLPREAVTVTILTGQNDSTNSPIVPEWTQSRPMNQLSVPTKALIEAGGQEIVTF